MPMAVFLFEIELCLYKKFLEGNHVYIRIQLVKGIPVILISNIHKNHYDVHFVTDVCL